MQVIATAGHVDHGKSTLVRALTGQDPDRLAEEHRRGLTIELGYCWTTLPEAGDVAFVDVPGHERFLTTMLAGVGPVPAVLFVVAADDPWMPQAAEHLAALNAFGVRHGVVAVTRADLADPAAMTVQAASRLRPTTLAGAPIVAVSARTGIGLDALRAALSTMTAGLPSPPSEGAVRLWVDRRFQVRGAGEVVTGTLPAGRIRVGDELRHGDQVVRVRGIESLGRPVDQIAGVARVALRLGRPVPGDVRRGSPLVSAGGWRHTDCLDVRVSGDGDLPEHPLLHIGSLSLGVRFRPLGERLGRVSLPSRVPLHVGDRLVLRDPGSRRMWAARVLDPWPPPLRVRGAARRRGEALAGSTGVPDLADELRRRGAARGADLERIGVTVPPTGLEAVAIRADDWLLASGRADDLRERLRELVAARARSSPLDPGLPLGVVARSLDLPATGLVAALVRPPLEVVGGRVVDGRATLPAPLLEALSRLEEQLARAPFAAPDAEQLARLGLDQAGLAAAESAGRLLRITESVALLPDAVERAAAALADLPQPFTTSQARVRLGTTRRVVLPLLAVLDARRLTTRLADDRREMRRDQDS